MNKPIPPAPPKAPPPVPPPAQPKPRVTRETRKPFGTLDQKLYYPAREGFHRHWFNDIPGRIDIALDAGYTHVFDKEQKKVSRVVDVAAGGGALIAYLMEIPQEWYEEDMKRQLKIVDDKEASIKQGALDEHPGENRYVPSRGITIKAGT